MKKLIVSFVIMLITIPSFSQKTEVDSTYKQSLLYLFEISGNNEAYKMAINQMFSMFKEKYSDAVPIDFWNAFETEMMKTSMNDLIDMLAPIYAKYMDLNDLKNIITFYSTPTGKKYAENTPYIIQESMEVGAAWGQKLGEDFVKKMKEKGY